MVMENATTGLKKRPSIQVYSG